MEKSFIDSHIGLSQAVSSKSYKFEFDEIEELKYLKESGISSSVNSLSENISLVNGEILKDLNNIQGYREAVIIGGGLIGLYLAVQLRQKNFDGIITIYEKHKEKSFNYNLTLPTLKECDSMNSIIAEKQKLKVVCAKDYYEALMTIIKKLDNIYIRYYEVDSLDLIFTLHVNPFIFACDGAYSFTRRAITNASPVVKNIFSILQFNYKVTSSKKPIKKMNVGDKLKIQKHLENVFRFIEETVNEDSIEVKVFVDDIVYALLSHFSLTAPGKLEDLKSMTDLKALEVSEAIQYYIKFRSFHNNEEFVKDSFLIASLKLNSYRSNKFTAKVDNQKIYLVGDSAMGIPFESNFGNGMIAANKVTDLLMKIENKPNDLINSISSNISCLFGQQKLDPEKIIGDTSIYDYEKFMNEFYDQAYSKSCQIYLNQSIKDSLVTIAYQIPQSFSKDSLAIEEKLISQIKI